MLLLLGVGLFIAALAAVGTDDWTAVNSHATFILISAAGLMVAAVLVLKAWTAAPDRVMHAQGYLLFAYCALLVGPASQIYTRVDTWQDLASIARAVEHDAGGKPLILLAPDETTRAIMDMYARTDLGLIPGPIDSAAIGRLQTQVRAAPQSLVVVQLPGRPTRIGQRLAQYLGLRQSTLEHAPPVESLLPWLSGTSLKTAKSYSLPNGRSYALLEFQP